MHDLQTVTVRPPVVSIAVINYESWDDVERLVTTLISAPEVTDGRCELIVVDNASRGPIPKLLESPTGPVRLIVREENGGFAAGVNTAWQAARGAWLLVLNPDIDPGEELPRRVLERVAAYRARGRILPAVVGFELREVDGTRQASVGREPGLFTSLTGQFLPRRCRKYQPDRRHQAGPAPWVTGACMLVNTAFLNDLGGMDEEFFLYYEEVALCREARNRGRDVEYDPTVSVVHFRPLQNRPLTPRMRLITRHSKLLYFRKHLPAWQFQALARVVACESLWRGLVCRWSGDPSGAQGWTMIGAITRRLRRGRRISPLVVRDLATALEHDRVAAASRPDAGHEPRPVATRPLGRPLSSRRSGQLVSD